MTQEIHDIQTSKSRPSEFKKQVSYESAGRILRNRRQIDFSPNFTLFGVKKDPKYGPWRLILYILVKVVSSELGKQVSCESSGKLPKNGQTTEFWPNFGPIQGLKEPENISPEGYNLHTPKSASDMPATLGPTVKTLWENGQNLQKYNGL